MESSGEIRGFFYEISLEFSTNMHLHITNEDDKISLKQKVFLNKMHKNRKKS